MKQQRWSLIRLGHFALMALTSAFLAIRPYGTARAEIPYDAVSSSALAIAAYEAGREHCLYSEKLGKALSEIDAFFSRNAGSQWDAAKRAGPDGLISLRNMATMLGAKSVCVAYGTAIGTVVPAYFLAAPVDADVLKELNLLMKGDGRSKSGEDEAHFTPPARSPEADMFAQMGISNAPVVAMEEFHNNYDKPPPEVVAKHQPSARSSSKPSEREPVKPAPTNQGTPSAPAVMANSSPLAPPTTQLAPVQTSATKSGGMQIPNSSARTGQCQLGVECRFEEPTFACNLDNAEGLATAGSDRGRKLGLEAVRASECEIVSADRPLLLEATKVPNVVYATERGKHVGYLPVGIFAPSEPQTIETDDTADNETMSVLTPAPKQPSLIACQRWAASQDPDSIVMWGTLLSGKSERDVALMRLTLSCMGDEKPEIASFYSSVGVADAFCEKHRSAKICKGH